MTAWLHGHPPNSEFVLNTLSPQAQGLVAWYPLGPGQYGLTGDVLNRHRLTPYAGPVCVGGSRGAVASFTKASSQYLAHLGTPFLDYPFTLSCWFRYLTSPSSFARDVLVAVSDRDDGYDRDQINIYNPSDVRLEAFTTTNFDAIAAARIDSPALALGTWYHAIAVFAAAASRTIYLNASMNATNTTNLSPTTRDTIAIGASVRSSGPTGYVGADISDVRVYNRALALTEIKQLYRNPWELYQPVVRWWVGAALGGGGDTDALTATSLATGAPVLGTPDIGQTHALTATALATGSPALATPTLAQEHVLAADDLATGAPVLGTPDIGQAHVLTADNLAAGTPALGEPVLAQAHALLAESIAAASPSLGMPTLAQAHALAATGITTDAPALGEPTLGVAGAALSADSLATGAPVLGAPTLGQAHALAAYILLVGVPLLGTPTLGIAGLTSKWRTWDVPAATRTYDVDADARSSAVGADVRVRTVMEGD